MICFFSSFKQIPHADRIDTIFTLGTSKNFGFKLTQSGDSATTITYNPVTNELIILLLHSGEIHPLKAKVNPINGMINLQILLDKSTLEAFANDGEKVIKKLVFPDIDATGISLFAKEGYVKIDSLKMHDFSDL